MVKPPRSHPFGRTLNAVLVALSFGLLAWVIGRNRAEVASVFSRSLDLRLFGLAFLITQISLLIIFVRWFILARVVEPRLTLRVSLLLGFVGHVFNLVIPGAVGGDVIKAAYLARMQIQRTQAIASMAIDRALGLLGLFVLAGAAGVLSWGAAMPVVRTLILVAWVGAAAGVVVLAALFSPTMSRLLSGFAGSGQGRLAAIILELRTMSMIYRKRLDVLLAGLGLAVISHVLNVLAFFVIGRMLFAERMTTTLAQHFVMVPLILLTTAIPLPFGALGLTEGVSDQLFGLVGHPSGALAMIGNRILALGCGLVSACVYLANMNKVRVDRLDTPIEDELDDLERREIGAAPRRLGP